LRIFIFFLVFCATTALADDAFYFYDDTGRLDRAVKGANALKYQYDPVGNLLSINKSAISASAPVIQSINPNVFFIGQKILATIAGQNFFSAKTVTTDNANVSVKILDVTDTGIKAEITVLSSASPGSITLTVTTLYGSGNIAASLSSSKLSFSPGQLTLAAGNTGSINASITPSIGQDLVITIGNSNSSIATVPGTLNVPSAGAASFNVTAVQNGVSTISSGDPKTIVFVAPHFYNEPGETTTSISPVVSVYIDAPLGNSALQSSNVSTYIDAGLGNSAMYAPIVSVQISP